VTNIIYIFEGRSWSWS